MEEKWQGVGRSPKIRGVAPAQAWAIVGDFYALHKVHPSFFHACSRVTDRCNGRPGSFRHTVMTLPCRGGHPPQCHWMKDRLLAYDPEGMKYTYEVVENSVGFGKTIVTLGVAPAGDDGCMIEWSYDCSPVEGWTHDQVEYLTQNGAAEIAKMVQETVDQAAKSQ